MISVLGKKLAGNVSASIAGKGINALLGLVTLAVLARHLGADGLGQYRIVLTILLFSSLAGDFGIYAVTLRELAKNPSAATQTIGNALACRLVCTSVAVGTAAALAWQINADPMIRVGLLIGAIGWVGYQASELLIGLFQVHLKQNYSATASVTATAVSLMVIIVLAAFDAGPVAMLFATSAGFLSGFAVSVWFARSLVHVRLIFDFPSWGKLMLAGLPIAGSTALHILHLRGDTAIMAYTVSAADVGIYDIGIKVYELAGAVAFMFGGLLLPLLTADLAHSWSRFEDRLAGAVTAIAAAMTGGLALLYVYADRIAMLVGGEEFAASAAPLRVLAISMWVAALAFTFRFAGLTLHRQKRILLMDSIAVAAAVALYVLLIPRWSYNGAVFGKLIGDVLILAGGVLVVGSLPALRSVIRPFAEIGLALLLMLIAIAGFDLVGLHWIPSAVLGLLFYALVLTRCIGVRRAMKWLIADPAPARAANPGS